MRRRLCNVDKLAKCHTMVQPVSSTIKCLFICTVCVLWEDCHNFMLHHRARQSNDKTTPDNGASMPLCCPSLTDLLAFNDSTISVMMLRAGAAATQLERGQRLHMQNHCQHCCHHTGQSCSGHRCSCAAPQAAPRGHQTAYGALSFLQPPCQAQMAREMHLPFEWSLMMRAFASWNVSIAYWRPRTAAYATYGQQQVPNAHDMSSKVKFWQVWYYQWAQYQLSRDPNTVHVPRCWTPLCSNLMNAYQSDIIIIDCD